MVRVLAALVVGVVLAIGASVGVVSVATPSPQPPQQAVVQLRQQVIFIGRVSPTGK